jgi:hypothetical protein
MSGAETLFFDARKLHTTSSVGRYYRQLQLPVPITRQKYYFWNRGGINYTRVESACAVQGLNMTTLFIRNPDGIWHLLPQCAAEVSSVFRRDQLLGTLPFFRFVSIPKYPYEVSESDAGIDQVLIKGRLAAKPVGSEEDISGEFSYLINTRNDHLCSLDEKTFAGRSLHLEFDILSTSEPMDYKLFDLPDRPKVRVSNMEQYLDLRQQEFADRVQVSPTSNSKACRRKGVNNLTFGNGVLGIHNSFST